MRQPLGSCPAPASDSAEAGAPTQPASRAGAAARRRIDRVQGKSTAPAAPTGQCADLVLKHDPEKLSDFSDEIMLQGIELARYLFNRMIPSGWIAR